MLDKIRYAASEIAENGGDPEWWRLRFVSRIAGPTVSALYGEPGIDFMQEDWDNLLILDACRADMFEQATDVSRYDEYRTVHSLGCTSAEWMAKTFEGERYPDTVYVTANPWISKIAPNVFHNIINLWEEKETVSTEELQTNGIPGTSIGSSGGETIHPDTLSTAAREAHDRYPNKRLIIHYFQPHGPVVGNPDGTRKDPEAHDGLHPDDDLRAGTVSREAVWNGFVDNLLYALHYAEELAEDIGGRSVFTADHGELFGERLWPFPIREYAHIEGVRHPRLTEVPWAVTEVSPRREIKEDGIIHQQVNETQINEHLRDLGYRV